MSVAPPTVTKRAIKEAVRALVDSSRLDSRLPEPVGVKTEHRFVDTPVDRTQVNVSSALLEEINVRAAALEQLGGSERESATQNLRELIDRYKTLTGRASGSTVEVGVEREKAPQPARLIHAAASRTLGRPVADVLADPRDTEVHHMQRQSNAIPEQVDDSIIERLEEGQDKAAKILGSIKTAAKPEEVAALVSELNTLEDEHGAGLLKRPEVGDFARQVETSINSELRQKAGSSAEMAEAAAKSITDKTRVAEHHAIHDSDIKGAAAQMEEVSRESVSYGEALLRVESLRNQAAYYALTGDREKADEKLAEMTVVSSGIPAAVKPTVMVAGKPNEVINGIERADGLDAAGALKVVFGMNRLAEEARQAGIEDADTVLVYNAAVKALMQNRSSGVSASMSGMLENPEGRRAIMQAMTK